MRSDEETGFSGEQPDSDNAAPTLNAVESVSRHAWRLLFCIQEGGSAKKASVIVYGTASCRW